MSFHVLRNRDASILNAGPRRVPAQVEDAGPTGGPRPPGDEPLDDGACGARPGARGVAPNHFQRPLGPPRQRLPTLHNLRATSHSTTELAGRVQERAASHRTTSNVRSAHPANVCQLSHLPQPTRPAELADEV